MGDFAKFAPSIFFVDVADAATAVLAADFGPWLGFMAVACIRQRKTAVAEQQSGL